MLDLAGQPPPVRSIAQWVGHTRSIRRALAILEPIAEHILLILPSTRGALKFARKLCTARTCCVTTGSVCEIYFRRSALQLSTPTEICKGCVGQALLPYTIVSFPDQLVGHGPGFVQFPFLGVLHSFSTLEALLVLRHRPRVFTLRTSSSMGDFGLVEILYEDLLTVDGRIHSVRDLMRRLFSSLEEELAFPPSDWLGSSCMAQKAQSASLIRTREALHQVEGLLRRHLLVSNCERTSIFSALAAINMVPE